MNSCLQCKHILKEIKLQWHKINSETFSVVYNKTPNTTPPISLAKTPSLLLIYSTCNPSSFQSSTFHCDRRNMHMFTESSYKCFGLFVVLLNLLTCFFPAMAQDLYVWNSPCQIGAIQRRYKGCCCFSRSAISFIRESLPFEFRKLCLYTWGYRLRVNSLDLKHKCQVFEIQNMTLNSGKGPWAHWFLVTSSGFTSNQFSFFIHSSLSVQEPQG